MKAIDQIYRTPAPPRNTPEDVALVRADTIKRFPDMPWFAGHARGSGGRPVSGSKARLYNVRAYIEKTLDNIEDSEAEWTAAEVREMLTDTLGYATGEVAL